MRRILLISLLLTGMIHAFTLSAEEKTLLQKYPLKCISTGQWPPFNLMENEKLVGMGIDYWNLVQKKLHIQSSCTIAKSWSDVLAAIKNHSADITIATQTTKKRLAYASFSKPYATYPIVIVTKNDTGFIDNVALLKDKTIAVGKDYVVAEIVEKYYPKLHISYTDSIDTALRSVDKGEAFAAIDILPVISYKLNKNDFPNLKISGSIPSRFLVSFMIRKDYDILLPLINRAIDAITQEEKDAISRKWITFRRQEQISRSYFYLLLTCSTILFLFFSVWLYMLKKEITKKNKITKQLQTLVTIDSLTSTCNRYMFDITLDKEIELARRHHYALSLIFFDIDGFKNINDRYGHKAGDNILKELAHIVSHAIRKSDTLCRWGGDEFIIILHNTKEETAKKLADSLDRLIRAHHFTPDIEMSCSFGVTEFRSEDTHESFMARVDALLYHSKENDRL